MSEDTSKEHGYALSRVEYTEVDGKKVGREVFFKRNGVSYGKGRVWLISPEQRLDLQLSLPVKRRRPVGRYVGTPAAKKKKQTEFEAFNSPEFLSQLQELLRKHAPL